MISLWPMVFKATAVVLGKKKGAHELCLLISGLYSDKFQTAFSKNSGYHTYRCLLFSCSVMPNSLWPHGLHHASPPCPSPSPRVCSNSCPLSQRCHPTISSSVTPFPCPQSFPASGSFPMSQFFTSGGPIIGTSASVLRMNIQGWFPILKISSLGPDSLFLDDLLVSSQPPSPLS